MQDDTSPCILASYGKCETHLKLNPPGSHEDPIEEVEVAALVT